MLVVLTIQRRKRVRLPCSYLDIHPQDGPDRLSSTYSRTVSTACPISWIILSQSGETRSSSEKSTGVRRKHRIAIQESMAHTGASATIEAVGYAITAHLAARGSTGSSSRDFSPPPVWCIILLGVEEELVSAFHYTEIHQGPPSSAFQAHESQEPCDTYDKYHGGVSTGIVVKLALFPFPTSLEGAGDDIVVKMNHFLGIWKKQGKHFVMRSRRFPFRLLRTILLSLWNETTREKNLISCYWKIARSYN